MGKVGKAVSKPFKSAGKAFSSLAKGDISGYLKNTASSFTWGISDEVLDVLKGEQPQVVDAAKTAVDTLASEAESTAKKRKSLYFTEGEELGQDTTRVFNTQKRGSIFS